MTLPRRGSRLITVGGTGRPRPDNWLLLATEPVRPAEVAEEVRAALARGMDFAAPGGSVHLTL